MFRCDFCAEVQCFRGVIIVKGHSHRAEEKTKAILREFFFNSLLLSANSKVLLSLGISLSLGVNWPGGSPVRYKWGALLNGGCD